MATQMQLKTFRGPSMADALSAVKKALGSDAVIVHTRTFKIGGWMGLGAKSVVEITATVDAPSHSKRVPSRPSPRPASRAAATHRRPEPIKPPVRDPQRAIAASLGARRYNTAASEGDGWSPDRSDEAAVALADNLTHASRSAGDSVPPSLTDASADASTDDPDGFVPTFGVRGVDDPDAAAALVEQAGQRDADPEPSIRPPARASREPRVIPRSKAEQLRRITVEPEVQAAAKSDVCVQLPESTPIGTTVRSPKLAASAELLAVRAPIAPVDERARHALEEEIGSIRRMMTQVLQASRHAAQGQVGAMPDALSAHYVALSDAGLDAQLADEVIGLVRDTLSPGELADEAVVRQAVLTALRDMIPVTGVGPRIEHKGRPTILALVGPTGVGKTTTLAKLAASLKLRQGKRIGLITCDTYRIAAVEQLRTYANIIGLPMRVAMSPMEVAQAVDSLDECDAVLIDTPGRSQHDRDRVAELRSYCDAVSPDETHLVLSTTVSPAVLERTADRFGALDPDRVILSKLDEAVGLGGVVSVVRRLGRPVSFVTTGQEVPDHIELASSDRLARAILDGGSDPMAVWGTREPAKARS